MSGAPHPNKENGHGSQTSLAPTKGLQAPDFLRERPARKKMEESPESQEGKDEHKGGFVSSLG